MLAGDICYERDLAATRHRLALRTSHDAGATVLIGDPGPQLPAADAARSRSPTYEVPVTRTLEDAEIKRTSVWRFRSARG